MPNWCKNSLRIDGDFENIIKFRDQAKNDKSVLMFGNFVPEPHFEAKNDWYHWRLDNWGTRSEVSFDVLADESDTYLEYQFDTAWLPPINWLVKVAQVFPTLSFELVYEEAGIGFRGIANACGENFNNSCEDYCFEEEKDD